MPVAPKGDESPLWVTSGQVEVLRARGRLCRHDVWELFDPLLPGDGRLQPGGHSSPGDQGQHYLGCVIGQRAAVTSSEAVCRWRPHHVGQNIREQFSCDSLAVALGIV
jgi:hypothetical protein